MNEEICFTLKLESFSVYLICDGETSKKTLKCWSINSLLIFVTNMFSVWRLWQVNPKWVSRSWNQRPSTHRIEAKNDRASFNMKMAQLSIRQIFSPSSEYFYLSRHSPISFSRTLSPRHTQTLYRLLACLQVLSLQLRPTRAPNLTLAMTLNWPTQISGHETRQNVGQVNCWHHFQKYASALKCLG